MRIPQSTYRLQMNNKFTLENANAIIPYLHSFGISDIYLSPIQQAVKGSMHGYDVIDHDLINNEIGTEKDLKNLSKQLKEKNMGLLLDIVPNHMAFNSENKYLVDIFENDQHSRYYNFFDINWNHTFESINGKLITPFLGRFYGECLDSGELSLIYNDFGFSVCYYENSFNLKIDTYHDILVYKQHKLKNVLGKDHPNYIKYLGVLYIIKNLSSDGADSKDRYDQVRFIKALLWELYNGCEEVKHFIDENIEEINGIAGNSESFNTLDEILSKQVFRLTYWKVATDEINYRRFFNVNGLISLKVEDDAVFAKVHEYIINLMINGYIDGLRIDHIDGLSNPESYLQKLKSRTNNAYVITEKILESNEILPDDWNCEGTVGYDFLNYMNGLFIRTSNSRVFTRIYRDFSGEDSVYTDLLYEKKRMMLTRHMSGDMDNLARLIKKIASNDRYASDYTFTGLKMALEELIVIFPIYRTYVNRDLITSQDKKIIIGTFKLAKKLNPSLIYELDFIENILLLKYLHKGKENLRAEIMEFVMRFQQYTGPLMAKGLEDTLFYSYNNFISLNEVGGDPGNFGTPVSQLHKFNLMRSKKYPFGMNASSTHDVKRGEDIRARLNVISELPIKWEKNIKKWHKLNKPHKLKNKKKEFPDKNDEYFIYQILIGSLPNTLDNIESYKLRINQYIIKAVRESKNHTNWLKPDEEYESAILNFIGEILDNKKDNQFLELFMPFHNIISYYGMLNSLSQLLLKMFSPGVPDLYQGCELWDFSFVDPDNRRPVDFDLRNNYLKEFTSIEKSQYQETMKRLIENYSDGKIKMLYTYLSLQIRNNYKEVFTNGDYIPLSIKGKHKECLTVFVRADKEKKTKIVVIISRFHTILNQEGNLEDAIASTYKNTKICIPDSIKGEYTDALTGNSYTLQGEMSASDILTVVTQAILISDSKETLTK